MKTVNKYIKEVTVLTIMLAGLVSCKKSFLEVTPKGRLIAQKTADYSLLLNNLQLVNIFDASDLYIGAPQVVLGDDVSAIEPDFSSSAIRTQRLFRWEDVVYESNQSASEMNVPMQNLYIYNKIINEVMNSADGTEQQKKSIRAEAQAGRAWTYFLLINYYGKPYNPATAATDPGFPIVSEADVTITNYKRASVKEVYDFIINDLATAIPDLPNPLIHRLRMSKTAGEALLGKVYMFMGKFAEALPLLNASFTDMAGAAVPIRLYNYNTAFGLGGPLFPVTIFGPEIPDAPDMEENIYAKRFISYWTLLYNEIVASSQTMALYDSSDLRLNYYSNMPFGGATTLPAGTMRRVGPAIVNYGVILPDLYLLRAECKARLNDLPGAVADVQTLRNNRMPDGTVAAGIASQQLPLIQFILEERIREFAVLGFRWFDMRRLSVDPLFTMPTYKHTLYSSTGVPTVFTLKPERLTMRFPQKVLDRNPGMENNP